ncbi:DUF4249 domain-containing protein [Sabulibacter ruber]|uniref:DUF4249 domain-containing protein n=1 Tax=Sabulibacter ruber TaxID=2811901 RepID=UPI001A958C06|nr:DUF4249 domain-containing protein [Sabulibacter ruber]
MRISFLYLCYGLGILLLLGSCREPFTPELEPSEANMLVVEGYINLGQDAVTTIKLSRVQPVTKQTWEQRERGATLMIEQEGGSTYPLQEDSAGVYVSDPLNLPVQANYRLRIQTKDGRKYSSALVSGKESPAIDNIIWKWDPDGLGIYANSKDTQGNTQYYQWTYEETWEIHSPYWSKLVYRDRSMHVRPYEESAKMFICWGSAKEKDILIGSSANFSKDTISFPVTKMPHRSAKTKVRYSILVKQHALSKQEFEFLEAMKKNTSNLGSFFDPQPSELTGNIASEANPEEIVIGFVGAYTTSEKRFFIKREELPPFDMGEECPPIKVVAVPDSLHKYFDSGSYIPIDSTIVFIDDKPVLAFEGRFGICVDCRTKGTSERPDFW